MSARAFIQSYAAVTPEGLFAPGAVMGWDADQRGPADIRREQILETPFTGFGKLRIAEKLAFAVSTLALNAFAGSPHAFGVVLGATHGSLSTDLRYRESVRGGFPRPAFFSATLPSSSVAEIAICHKITGPNRAFVGCDAADAALESALRGLSHGKAPGMLVIAVDAMEEADRDTAFAAGIPAGPDRALCFVLDAGRPQRRSPWHIWLEPGCGCQIAPPEAGQSYFLKSIQKILDTAPSGRTVHPGQYGRFHVGKAGNGSTDA
jgi:hypothetical protein